MKIESSHTHVSSMAKQKSVLAYFKEKGRRTIGSRIEYYEKLVDRFLLKPELTDSEAWSLAELQELYVVIHGARKDKRIDDQTLKCLKGAHTLDDENSKNSGNAARNITFELYIASKMVIFGADVSIPPFGTGADILFTCDEKKVPIECKRLYAQGRVGQLMQDACSQVSSRVDDGSFGIAAISLTREFWASHSSSVIESVDEARIAAEQLYLTWRAKAAEMLATYPKVALIYIHIYLPCVGEDNRFTVYEREFYRTRKNYEGLSEAAIVDDFERVMRSIGIADAIGSRFPETSATVNGAS